MAITVSDFNNIRTTLLNVYHSGGTAYNQALDPDNTAATSASVITTTLWNGLGNDLRRARQHQTGVEVTSAELPVLQRTTQITNTVYNQFVTMANTVASNKFAIGTNALVRSQEGIQTATSGTWSVPALYHKVVLTFPGYTSTRTVNGRTTTLAVSAQNHARAFFNAGGEIRFRASRTGTAANTKDTDWTDILAAMGTIRFHWQSTNTSPEFTATSPGTVPVGSTGFFVSPGFTSVNLPTSNTNIFFKTGSAYGTNRYNITLRADSATAPTVLTFIVSFQDNATGGLDEPITGTTTSVIEMIRPSGSTVNVPGPTTTEQNAGGTLSTVVLS